MFYNTYDEHDGIWRCQWNQQFFWVFSSPFIHCYKLRVPDHFTTTARGPHTRGHAHDAHDLTTQRSHAHNSALQQTDKAASYIHGEKMTD